MKEATGELNMTVITVVAIAAVAAFFYAFVWPSIQKSIEKGTNCANSFNCTCPTDPNQECTCNYYDKNGNVQNDLKCPNSAAGK